MVESLLKRYFDKIEIDEYETREGCLIVARLTIRAAATKDELSTDIDIKKILVKQIFDGLYKDIPLCGRNLGMKDFMVETTKDGVVFIERAIKATYDIVRDDYFDYEEMIEVLKEKLKIDIINKIYNVEAIIDYQQNKSISNENDEN